MGFKEGHRRWREKSVFFCSSNLLQAISRKFPQWPNAIFRIPDMLQWLVVITESRVIEEIRKAPENLLSFMDSLDEVSSFRSSPCCSTNGNMSRHFSSNTLSGAISPRTHTTSLLSEPNSPGLYRNSFQRCMKRLSMLSTNIYPRPAVRFEACAIYCITLILI